MTKRENQRRREREFNKFQERNNKFQDRRDDRKEKNNTSNESMREDLIIGRNAVIEALKSDRTIECVYVSILPPVRKVRFTSRITFGTKFSLTTPDQ